VYDFETNTWATLTASGDVPSGRSFSAAAVAYDTSDGTARAYVVGGRDRYSELIDVYIGTHVVDMCSAGNVTATGLAADCVACSAGEYSVVGAYACTQCGAGSYTETTGQSSCDLCSAGRYSTVVGSSSSGNCQLCDGGRFVCRMSCVVCRVSCCFVVRYTLPLKCVPFLG